MARRSRQSILKRQREQKRAEKAAAKRQKREERRRLAAEGIDPDLLDEDGNLPDGVGDGDGPDTEVEAEGGDEIGAGSEVVIGAAGEIIVKHQPGKRDDDSPGD